MAPKKNTPDSTPNSENLTRPSLWNYYRVRWTFLTKLCSSVPADPNIVRKWLEARQPRVKAAGAKTIQEINEEVVASLERGEGEPDQETSMLVFQHAHAPYGEMDTGGNLVMRAATVKAHIKDCARVLSAQYIGRIANERAFSTRVVNGVYHDESVYWLPIMRQDGSPIAEADGAYEKPIHTRGPQGVQNAIKCFEYVEPPSVLEFTLKTLGKSIPLSDLEMLFTYGGVHGYAGERSDGQGRYQFTIEPLNATA